MALTLALGRQRQANLEFPASQSYIRPCLLEERTVLSTTGASLHPSKSPILIWLSYCCEFTLTMIFLLNKQSTPDPVMNTFSTPGTIIGWSCWYIFILDDLIRALFIHGMNPMQSAWAHTMLPPYFV